MIVDDKIKGDIMTSYPSDLPLSEIKDIITIIRAGEISAKKAEFVHSLWVVQGYAQSCIVGSPTVVTIQAGEEDPVTLLEKAITTAENNQLTAQGFKEILSKIDWAIVLQWVVKLLIDQLLKAE